MRFHENDSLTVETPSDRNSTLSIFQKYSYFCEKLVDLPVLSGMNYNGSADRNNEQCTK